MANAEYPENDELQSLNSFDELRKYAAENGIRITATENARLADVRDKAAYAFEQKQKRISSWHERLNRAIPSMQNAVVNFSRFMFIAMRMVATTLIIPIVLVVVALVEMFRVAHGIQIFEVSTWLAYLGAVALVLSNVVLEFNIADIEHSAGYTKPRAKEFSLRLVAQRMAYILGMGSAWKAALKSPASRFHGMARLLKVGILILAVMGSMRGMFESVQGSWYEGLQEIATKSTLLDVVTWTGGLIFAWLVVSLTQTLTAYSAELAIAAENSLEQNADHDKEAYITAQAAYELKTIISKKLQTAKEKRLSQANTFPPEIPANVTSNGNGNHSTYSE